MLVATMVGVIFVPFFFAEIRGLSERGIFRRKTQSAAIPATAGTPAPERGP
jgi:hypothetical protein